MLNEAVLAGIEKVTDSIYSPDQEELDSAFLELLNELMAFVESMAQSGYSVDMTEELTAIESAYAKRDLVELADILLYDMKPVFLEILV